MQKVNFNVPEGESQVLLYEDGVLYMYGGTFSIGEKRRLDEITLEEMKLHTESELEIDDFVKDGPFTILSDNYDDISYITHKGEYVAQINEFPDYGDKQSKRGLSFIVNEP